MSLRQITVYGTAIEIDHRTDKQLREQIYQAMWEAKIANLYITIDGASERAGSACVS